MSNKEEVRKIEDSESFKTVESMNKEEVKKEKKVEYRRPNLDYRGRLYIDPKYKRPGKVLRVVNDTPGNIDYLQSIGYTFVTREVKVGEGSLQDTGGVGSAVTLDVGRIHSQKAVLMEIDEDLYNERQEEKARINKEQLNQKIDENRYQGQK